MWECAPRVWEHRGYVPGVWEYMGVCHWGMKTCGGVHLGSENIVVYIYLVWEHRGVPLGSENKFGVCSCSISSLFTTRKLFHFQQFYSLTSIISRTFCMTEKSLVKNILKNTTGNSFCEHFPGFLMIKTLLSLKV